MLSLDERRYLARLCIARGADATVVVAAGRLRSAEAELGCAVPTLLIAALGLVQKDVYYVVQQHLDAEDYGPVPKEAVAFAPTGVDGGYLCFHREPNRHARFATIYEDTDLETLDTKWSFDLEATEQGPWVIEPSEVFGYHPFGSVLPGEDENADEIDVLSRRIAIRLVDDPTMTEERVTTPLGRGSVVSRAEGKVTVQLDAGVRKTLVETVVRPIHDEG